MATTLTRWNPWQEVNELRRNMERMFGDGFSHLAERPGQDEIAPYSIALNVIENADKFLVKAAVPGMKPEDVEISLENDVLTIRGQHSQEGSTEDQNYVRRELSWGSFERSLRLPPTVDADHAEADFEHGMLTISLPKKAEAQPKKITINPRGVIEGEQN